MAFAGLTFGFAGGLVLVEEVLVDVDDDVLVDVDDDVLVVVDVVVLEVVTEALDVRAAGLGEAARAAAGAISTLQSARASSRACAGTGACRGWRSFRIMD
ncbi:MAG: hypothetical protein ACLP01_08595 [Solirubrobacteraceae bacterium]